MYYNWVEKEQYFRQFFFKKELQKTILKSAMANGFLAWDIKFYFFFKFFKFRKLSSIAFYRNKCLINDWSRSVFRRFKMSRHQCKFFASFGFICGLRKSSF